MLILKECMTKPLAVHIDFHTLLFQQEPKARSDKEQSNNIFVVTTATTQIVFDKYLWYYD